jgi:hypothetical protein
LFLGGFSDRKGPHRRQYCPRRKGTGNANPRLVDLVKHPGISQRARSDLIIDIREYDIAPDPSRHKKRDSVCRGGVAVEALGKGCGFCPGNDPIGGIASPSGRAPSAAVQEQSHREEGKGENKRKLSFQKHPIKLFNTGVPL